MNSKTRIVAIYSAIGVAVAVVTFFVIFSLSIPKPNTIMPESFIHPRHTAIVVFVKGASQQSSPIHLDPRKVTVVMGVNNTVEWINQDVVPFSFDSGNGYIDPVSGNFSTFAQVKDGILLPGQSFNFTFTRPGNYSYYGIPGPFIQGTVIVLLPSQP